MMSPSPPLARIDHSGEGYPAMHGPSQPPSLGSLPSAVVELGIVQKLMSALFLCATHLPFSLFVYSRYPSPRGADSHTHARIFGFTIVTAQFESDF